MNRQPSEQAVGNPAEDRRRDDFLDMLFRCDHGVERCQSCTTRATCPHECVDCYVLNGETTDLPSAELAEKKPDAFRVEDAGDVACRRCSMKGLVWKKSVRGKWYSAEVWSVVNPKSDDTRDRVFDERPHFLTCPAKKGGAS